MTACPCGHTSKLTIYPLPGVRAVVAMPHFFAHPWYTSDAQPAGTGTLALPGHTELNTVCCNVCRLDLYVLVPSVRVYTVTMPSGRTQFTTVRLAT